MFETWAREYLETKSRHDAGALLGHFADGVAYEDAVLSRSSSRDQLRASYEKVFAGLPADARSRLVWAAGDGSGGAVRFDNDAAFFGADLKVLAVVELADGLVVRQRDYWDGRQAGSVVDEVRRTFPPHRPPGPGAAVLPHPGAAALTALAAALWPVADVADLLAPDVVLRELTAGVEITGRDAVAAYLAAVADIAPYGAGASLAAVVGGPGGGALEWAAPGIGGGVLGVRAGSDGVTELVLCWDASALPAGDADLLVARLREAAR